MQKSFSIIDIETAVANYYGITRDELFRRPRHGRKDSNVNAHRRFVLIHLARELTNLSYPQIAHHLNFKDHTSVMHGARRAAQLMLDDSEFRGAVGAVTELLHHVETYAERMKRSVDGGLVFSPRLIAAPSSIARVMAQAELFAAVSP